MFSLFLGKASCYIKWILMSTPPLCCSWLDWLKLGQWTSFSCRFLKFGGRCGHWGFLELSQKEDTPPPNSSCWALGAALVPGPLSSTLLTSYSIPWATPTSFFFCLHWLELISTTYKPMRYTCTSTITLFRKKIHSFHNSYRIFLTSLQHD